MSVVIVAYIISVQVKPGLTIIKHYRTIFVFILQNHPIKTKYVFDTMF